MAKWFLLRRGRRSTARLRDRQPFAQQPSAQTVHGFHRQHVMTVALRIDQRDKLVLLIAKCGAGFVAQDQLVVPVADFVLQFFQSLADSDRMRVFRCGFGNIPGLLRTFAKIVQIAFIQLLHFVHKSREGFERNYGGAARTAPRPSSLLHCRF